MEEKEPSRLSASNELIVIPSNKSINGTIRKWLMKEIQVGRSGREVIEAVTYTNSRLKIVKWKLIIIRTQVGLIPHLVQTV